MVNFDDILTSKAGVKKLITFESTFIEVPREVKVHDFVQYRKPRAFASAFDRLEAKFLVFFLRFPPPFFFPVRTAI